MQQPSLKQQLFRKLSIPIIMALSVIGLVSFAIIYYAIGEMHDDQLEDVADVLWILTEKEINEQPVEHSDLSIFTAKNKHDLEKYKDWLAFRIWKNGTLISSSINARPDSIPAAPKDFSDFTYHSKEWRAYAFYDPKHKVIVEVAGKYSEREELTSLILLGLIIPLLFSFPVVIILIRRGIKGGLHSLDKVTNQVQSRSPIYLNKLPTNNIPSELLPLADAINSLMTKLEISLEHERRFTDNAAHELRTPLAVIKSQAQIATRSEQSEERRKALSNLLSGVDGISRLVEQLLVLSRLYSQPITCASLNLTSVVRDVAAELTPFALAKNITISLEGDEVITISSQHEILSILIRNLVDNAIKYTPDGGFVTLRVYEQNDKAILDITDNGQGIPAEEREKVLGRFYRLASGNTPGSGIGLSIVNTITELFKAEFTLDTPPNGQGTVARVVFNRIL